MERRVFVLTSAGERGPFTVDDLKRELQSGAVQRSDQLRTAMGKTVGTVGEMIGPGAPSRSSGRMPVPHSSSSSRQSSATSLRPISQSVRTGSDRLTLRTERTKQVSLIARLIPIFFVVALLMLFTGGWWLSRSNAAAAEKIAAAALVHAEVQPPSIRVDVIDGVATPAKPGLVRITSDQVLSAPLMIRGVCQGFPTVSFQLPAGATTIDIPVRLTPKPTADQRDKKTEKFITQAVVTLQPGAGYRLGTGFTATVSLKWRPDPSVANEDFVGHDHGWSGPWTRTLVALPGFGAKVEGGDYFRPLAQRLESGNVWLSFRLRADYNPDQVAGFSFYDHDGEKLFIGRSSKREGLSLEYTLDNERCLVIPEHQFTTPARVVVCVRMVSPNCTISWWVSPIVDGGEAPAPLGTVTLPAFSIDSVRVFAEQAWAIGDLRLGRTWEEVVPLP